MKELQSESRRAAEQARGLARPPRISTGVWVLLRLAHSLCEHESEADLVATHVLQSRCGKRAQPGGGVAEPPHLGPLAAPIVVRAAADHLDAGFQSRLLWRAAQLVAEARVVLRINVANIRGSSPSLAEVAQWLVDHWPVRERRGRYATLVANLSGRSNRKGWATRFRKRWHIRLRIMPWRSAVAPELQSRKVFLGALGVIF